MRRLITHVLLLTALTLLPTHLHAAVWFVDLNNTGTQDGTGWATAFTTVQAGIDAAITGDTVRVADGVYSGEGNKNLNFKGKTLTVESANGPQNCIIDSQGNGRGFLFNSGEGPAAKVAGFTIKNGDGGGIYGFNSSPTIENCIITENANNALMGGAIWFNGGAQPVVRNCVISHNSAEQGGGIALNGVSSATIADCVITDNTSTGAGGGISAVTSVLVIENALVADNAAGGSGGGIFGLDATFDIVHTTIAANSAADGGGVGVTNGVLALVNSIVWGNLPDGVRSDGAQVQASYSDIQGGWPGEGNLHGDPLFVDPGNGNFRLDVRSPCMNAGSALSGLDADLDGNPRPQNGAFDLGAYEVNAYAPVRPVVDSFTADTTVGFVPFDVTFACRAHDPDGAIAAYTIDYGDGSPAETNQTGDFTHAYTIPGTGDATCIVEDDGGAQTYSPSLSVDRHREITVPAPYATIQAAVDAAANGDVVIVAPGTYTGEGNKNIDFKGKAITVRSQSGPAQTVIDCEKSGRGFLFASGETNDAIVSGFTIVNGKAAYGGGIFVSASSPTIADCVIRNNETTWLYGDHYGGGLYCTGTVMRPIAPVIRNCLIVGNRAGRRGGGVYFFACNATVVNCTIVGNATGNDLDAAGGGIYAQASSATATNSILRGNRPDQVAGMATVAYCNLEGGAIGPGNVDEPPGWLDPANGDYRLKDASLMISAGTLEGAPTTDITGNVRPDPSGSLPDMGAYENSLAQPQAPALDMFGMAVGNRWHYAGTRQEAPLSIEREIVAYDATTFPAATYVFEIRENGATVGREYFQRTGDQLLIWGGTVDGLNIRFAQGLPVAWFPMAVGAFREKATTATFDELPGLTFDFSLRAEVVAATTLALDAGTFEAYEVVYVERVWGYDIDVTESFTWWLVPYIGVVQDRDAETDVRLTAFELGGGTFSERSDYDADGLADYRELLYSGTDRLTADSDGDGCKDGLEWYGDRDPLVADPQGDLNGDCALTLQDAVVGLQVLAGWQPAVIELGAAVADPGAIGWAETLYVLQRVAGLR